MSELKISETVKDRVCFLISRHHTYKDIDSIDWQILVEADFIVNLYEDNESVDTINRVYENVFKTDSGKKLLSQVFGL